MLDILTTSNDPGRILRRQAAKVDDPTSDEMRSLVVQMIETMREADGVGLAAPQVGRSIRLFVVEVDGRVSVFFNPVITEYSEEREISEEGCLSVPGVFYDVLRSLRIRMEFVDINGKRSTIDAEGFLACVLQHEFDHLEGTLFIDRIALGSVDHNTPNAYAL